MQVKGKEIDLILDDWVDDKKANGEEGGGYWTQLCVEHAHLVKDFGLSDKYEGHGICGVKGCQKEADYYYDFTEKDIR